MQYHRCIAWQFCNAVCAMFFSKYLLWYRHNQNLSTVYAAIKIHPIVVTACRSTICYHHCIMQYYRCIAWQFRNAVCMCLKFFSHYLLWCRHYQNLSIVYTAIKITLLVSQPVGLHGIPAVNWEGTDVQHHLSSLVADKATHNLSVKLFLILFHKRMSQLCHNTSELCNQWRQTGMRYELHVLEDT